MKSETPIPLGVRLRARAPLRRRLVDAAARVVVTAGGMLVIASIAAILFFLGREVLPLWASARIDARGAVVAPEAFAAAPPAADPGGEFAVAATAAGRLVAYDLRAWRRLGELSDGAVRGERPVAWARAAEGTWWMATEQGSLVAVRARFEPGGERPPLGVPQLEELEGWSCFAPGALPDRFAASAPGRRRVAVIFARGKGAAVEFVTIAERRSLFGPVQRAEVRRDLPVPPGSRATALAITADGARAYVGTDGGQLQGWDLTEPERPRLLDAVSASSQPAAVTALALLAGDITVVAGSGSGEVSTWFLVQDSGRASGWRLQRAGVFAQHRGAVTAVAASPRNKSFVTAGADGVLALHHATTGRTRAAVRGLDGAVAGLAFFPKGDGAAAVDVSGTLHSWRIVDPHPGASLRALFGKLWYEGYPEPGYVWQSTGGTDEVEPKLSLIPLLLGTAKGMLYALLFAVPLAVLGALYTAQFAHPIVRAAVKPAVEIMAALPSVILGLVAGLWLAPLLEGRAPGALVALVVLPAGALAMGFFWRALPGQLRSRVPAGTEAMWLVPLLTAAAALCLWASPWVEAAVFGGDFRSWLLQRAGLRYDQRNCMVVGFAMGFAVIPIVFTISEDALASVPQRLISGSLALGATRWQTAVRLVLPTASPGIFSAIMIGFGRAVGETMIVLMATGNTPILDWNIFTGMRTLSANIAVELPEAPVGSTLYRVLFLSALLLFAVTFAVNTLAEVVRQWFRQRYQRL